MGATQWKRKPAHKTVIIERGYILLQANSTERLHVLGDVQRSCVAAEVWFALLCLNLIVDSNSLYCRQQEKALARHKKAIQGAKSTLPVNRPTSGVERDGEIAVLSKLGVADLNLSCRSQRVGGNDVPDDMLRATSINLP